MQTYGSRNVLSLLPRIVELANIPVVFELCQAVLGEKLGVDDPRSSRRHGTGEWTALRPTRQSSIGKLREESSAIAASEGKPIYCDQGSVMLMRPLLSHSSIGCMTRPATV